MDSGLKYLVLDGVGVAPLVDNLYYLGSDSLGFIGLKFPDLKLYQLDVNTLSLENMAGGTYKSLVLGELASGPTNGNTLLLKANDITFVTLTTGATDVCTLGAVTVGSGLIWSAAQNLNSQILTNANIDSGTIDGVTITAAALSGVFTAAAAVTLPAFTLGGTITGGNQTVNNLGHIGLANTASAATAVITGNKAFAGLTAAVYWLNLSLNPYGAIGSYNSTGIYILSDVGPGSDASGIHCAIDAVLTATPYGTGAFSASPIGACGIKASVWHTMASLTVTGMAAFWAAKWGANVASGIVTNAYGMYIASPTVTGTVTNAYGIYIANITGAGTLNYAIYSAGGAWYMSGALTVGSDVAWLPTTDQQWSIGSDAKRLLLVRAVTVTSGRHNFDDKFYMEEDNEFLRFHDYQTRTCLMKLDREGNLYIRGAIKEWN